MNQMMMQAMQAIQEAQKRMGEVQAKLKTMSVTIDGGNGMVKATASGEGKLTKLEISPEMIKEEEKEMLEDLILTTVNKAIEAANGMREHEMKSATAGLLPNIPGMNLPFGL